MGPVVHGGLSATVKWASDPLRNDPSSGKIITPRTYNLLSTFVIPQGRSKLYLKQSGLSTSATAQDYIIWD